MHRNTNKTNDITIFAQKVCSSKTFATSERSVRIFEFLLQCYFDELHVKESVIAIELVKNKKEEANLDGKIRGYMFTLRKKLEEYYNGEGKRDKIKFHIPKGQYNLSYIKNTSVSSRKKFLKYIIPALIFILVLGILVTKVSKPALYCWKPFMDKNKPTICCVGDHYTIMGDIINGERAAFYNFKVNNNTDLKAFQKEDSIHTYEAADFSFVTKMGPIGTAELAYFFAKNNKKIEVLMESDLSLDNLHANNTVYIGPYQNMEHLKYLFLSNSEKFKYDRHAIYNKLTGAKYVNASKGDVRKEHVVVSYKPIGETGTHILFITANNDIGVLAMVKNLSNPKWLKAFYKNLPSKDAYYNALFKVQGVIRTDLSCELVEIELLN